METARLRTEEIVGLGVAVVLHLVLLGAFLLKPAPVLIEPIQTVTVSLAEEVGLEATAPEPVAESRMAMAPTLSDFPAPPVMQPDALSVPAPVSAPAPAATRTPPKPRATSAPRRRAVPKQPDRTERRRPDKPESRPKAPPKARPKTGGASKRFDEAFAGSGSSTTTRETRPPARTFGASEKSALRQAIRRQLRPRWSAPQGLDAEKLVTIVSFRLNKDGSLAGRPRVVRQSGDNAANRAQKTLHGERAIRAVQLAAPFKLPPEFYDKWKYISEWRFDRRL